MRILFSTQSESLRLFYYLFQELKESDDAQKAGFLISDSVFYNKWLLEKPTFEKEKHFLIKEWEIVSKPFEQPDLKTLGNYEREIGGKPGLFGAIVADRRLFLGKNCSFTQDYDRRFSDSEMLCILQRSLGKIEKIFNELNPDLVVNFICVTLFDYLVYLFAKSRGVRFLNLRSTRIFDKIALYSTINDPSPELEDIYLKLYKQNESSFHNDAKKYLSTVREKYCIYEGCIKSEGKPILRNQKIDFNYLKKGFKKLIQLLPSNSVTLIKDNSVPHPLRRFYNNRFKTPLRAKKCEIYLKKIYLDENQLKNTNYAFFPLHTEPECSLLVYGRPFLNQIELIRMIALNLPVDMVLLIKEHPWMVGKRSLSAYKKILNIPRVKIVNPAINSRILVKESSLVTVITGTIALEAVILGKPVITFGDIPYNVLPYKMIQRCTDLRHLNSMIRNILQTYEIDLKALEAYVCAVFETSISANLYSVLLNKEDVHFENKSDFKDEIKNIANYLKKLLKKDPLKVKSNQKIIW